jgi:hypothetical protein
MAVNRPSVGGPEFAALVRDVGEKVDELEANNWDFDSVPEVFARDAAADVLAKDLVQIHDGRTMTRMGRLILGGVGSNFNLMGTMHADSKFQVVGSGLLDEVNAQLGSNGLTDMPEYQALEERWGKPQDIDYHNYGVFYTLKDLVFWLLLHDAGCFPSTLETMVRRFAEGKVVQNNMYGPARPSFDKDNPAMMAGACLMLQFPSKIVEWMEQPMFGGLQEDTIVVEHLLTIQEADVSHPLLPLVVESKVRLRQQDYYVKTFAGVTPKDALRGPDVPPERPGESPPPGRGESSR